MKHFCHYKCCKLTREQTENAKEWIGCYRVRANKCGYKEKDRKLKELFINSTNDDDVKTERNTRTDCSQKGK